MLLLCIVLLPLLTLEVYRFVDGFQRWRHNREIKQGYVNEIERLSQEQQRLKEEIDKLKHNRLTQERLAREMGYVKPGETVYKIAPEAQALESPRTQGSDKLFEKKFSSLWKRLERKGSRGVRPLEQKRVQGGVHP